MDNRKLRDCLGLFATGVVIACARRRNFLLEKLPAEKILDHKIISETALGKVVLQKLKKFFGDQFFADQFFGMTINSFSSVSLNPPLVLFSVDNRSSNLDLFKKNKSFSLNILSENQVDLAKAFATPKNGSKWGLEPYLLGKLDNPIFQNSLGFFECKKHKMIKAGDHHIIIGEVIDFAKMNEEKPLTYYRGSFSNL